MLEGGRLWKHGLLSFSTEVITRYAIITKSRQYIPSYMDPPTNATILSITDALYSK